MRDKKRSRLVTKAALCVLVLGGLGLLCADITFEPQTPLGCTVFRTAYTLSPDKNAPLRDYDHDLWAHNGSYIPEPTDGFLCGRLQHSTSGEEIDAITDFYIRHADGRLGRYIYRLPPQTRQRVTGLILSRLDAETPDEAEHALVLAEALRRGDDLGKAVLASRRDDTPDDSDYGTWWQKAGLREAKSRFRTWWNAYPTWTQKEKHDPLQYSSLQIISP